MPPQLRDRETAGEGGSIEHEYHCLPTAGRSCGRG